MDEQNAHFHWEFLATDTGQVRPVVLTVIGYLGEPEALAAVQDLVHRDNYELKRVWECNTCRYQERVASMFSKITSWGR